MNSFTDHFATSRTASALLGTATRPLTLRVQSAHESRVVEVETNKCSIGSSESCTIRLREPGVQPVHCVILRGPDRTVIRRWADDTWLNDATFMDAELHPNDVIRIKNIEIRVSFGNHRHEAIPTARAKGTNENPKTRSLVRRLRVAEERVVELESHLQHHESHTANMAGRLQQIEQKVHETNNRRFQQLFRKLLSEKGMLERQLGQQRVLYQQERFQLQSDIDRLASEISRQQDRIEFEQRRNAAKQERLDELNNSSQAVLTAELARVREAETQIEEQRVTLSQRLAEIEAERARGERELADSRAEVNNSQQRLDALTQDLEQQKVRVAKEKSELTERLDVIQAELDDRNQAYREVQGQLSDCQEELVAAQEELEAAQELATQAEASADDQRARLSEQINTLTKKCADLEDQRNSLQAELESLRGAADSSQQHLEQISSLEQRLNEQEADWQNRENDWQNRENEWQDRENDWQNRETEWQDREGEWQDRIDALENELSELNQEIEKLREAAAQPEAENSIAVEPSSKPDATEQDPSSKLDLLARPEDDASESDLSPQITDFLRDLASQGTEVSDESDSDNMASDVVGEMPTPGASVSIENHESTDVEVQDERSTTDDLLADLRSTLDSVRLGNDEQRAPNLECQDEEVTEFAAESKPEASFDEPADEPTLDAEALDPTPPTPAFDEPAEVVPADVQPSNTLDGEMTTDFDRSSEFEAESSFEEDTDFEATAEFVATEEEHPVAEPESQPAEQDFSAEFSSTDAVSFDEPDFSENANGFDDLVPAETNALDSNEPLQDIEPGFGETSELDDPSDASANTASSDEDQLLARIRSLVSSDQSNFEEKNAEETDELDAADSLDPFSKLRAQTEALVDAIPSSQSVPEPEESLPTHEELPTENEPSASAAVPSFVSALPAEPKAPVNPEDVSIDDYMQQLLQRVGNPGSSAAVNPQPTTSDAPVVDDEIDAPVNQEKKRAAQETTRNPLNAASTKERKETPVVDLEAMRELANESTRSALTRHAKKSSQREALSNLGTAIIGVLAAAILAILSRGELSIFFFGALIGSIVAAFYGYLAFQKGAMRIVMSIGRGKGAGTVKVIETPTAAMELSEQQLAAPNAELPELDGIGDGPALVANPATEPTS